MSSSILNIIAISLGIIAIGITLYSASRTSTAGIFKKMFANEKDPETIQEILLKIATKLEKLDNSQHKQEQELSEISSVLNTAIKHVGIVRFDSGASDGGNLSFSIALLDGSQTGIILTSLHGREHNRVYVKPVDQGTSPNILSDEETEAIMQALTGPERNVSNKKPKNRKTQIDKES